MPGKMIQSVVKGKKMFFNAYFYRKLEYSGDECYINTV